MMRKLFVAAMMVGLVGLGGVVRDAQAGATVDLLFRSNGSDSITAALGDTLVLDVFMRNDQTLSLAQFGVQYDVALGNQLDVVSAFSWVGVVAGPKAGNKFVPISAVNPNAGANLVNSFNSAVGVPPALPLPVFGGGFAAANPDGYHMGTITWVVVGGGPSTLITPGMNLQGILGQAFGAGTGGTVPLANLVFNGATVLIPEPATAALLGLGLVGIVVVGRRNRRS